MRKFRNLFAFALAACLILAGCGGEEPAPVYTYPTEPTQQPQDLGEVTILFTGKAQNVFEQNETRGEIGYAALAAYRDMLEDDDQTVILVDGGGAFSNQAAGAVKNGRTLADLIGSVGYDIRVPGRDEMTYGIEAFVSLTEKMENGTYLSCNLVDGAGETVFEPYVILECGAVKVGFVGITTPRAAETLEDDAYGFGQGSSKDDFYAAIQDAIDAAGDAGAEYVIAVGNLGTDPMDTPWTSAEVIANTTGLSAFLDSGSGAVREGNPVQDLDNYEIPVCSVGSAFNYVGKITLDLNDGSVEVELLTELEDEDKTIAQAAADLAEELKKE